MGRCTHGCFSPRVGTALTWWMRICFLLIPRCRTNMREFRTDGSWLSLWRGRKLPVNPHACPSSSVCAYSVRSSSSSGVPAPPNGVWHTLAKVIAPVSPSRSMT